MAKAGVEVNGVGAAVPPLNADVLEKLVSAKEKNQSAFGPDRVDHDRGAAIPQSPASELQHLVLDHPLQDKIVLMMRGNLQNDPVAAAAPATIAICADRLVFADVDRDDVTFVKSSGNLLISIAPSGPGASDGGSITVAGIPGSSGDQGLEYFEFAGGDVLSKADLIVLLSMLTGTSGNDTIVGSSTNETILGGGGDDVLNGAGGNDTYLYSRGHGHDTISEITNAQGNADKLQFTDVNASDVTLVRTDLDLKIVIGESSPGAGDAGSVLIKAMLDDYWDRGVETISFADGVNWTRGHVSALVLAQAGTSADDTIVGFNTNDTLAGGLGNDVLSGVAGNDTYVYSRGHGNDTINETSNAQGNADKLIFTDIDSTAVTLSYAGIDLTILVGESGPGAGDGGSVLIKAMLDDYWDRGVETISFADGVNWTRAQVSALALAQAATSGNDTIVGFNTNDTLAGGAGNDVLAGAGGNDTYSYSRGHGHDTINETSNAQGNADKLIFTNIDSTAVTLSYTGTDLTILVGESSPGAGDTGSVLIKAMLDDYWDRGVETISFADGVNWNRAQVSALALAQAATSGNDTIVGFNTNDTLAGGTGNDVLSGAGGNDTYLYSRGHGNDTINEAANAQGSGDALTFADIASGFVTLARNGNDLIVEISESMTGAGDGGYIIVRESISVTSERGIEVMTFSNGITWDRSQMVAKIAYVGGTSANETITGTTGDDTIMAGRGDDTLVGFGGNDTFVLGAGFGRDVINDFSAGAGAGDIIRINSALFADFTSIMAATSQVGSDAIIAYDNDNQIRLKNVSVASLHADDFAFG